MQIPTSKNQARTVLSTSRRGMDLLFNSHDPHTSQAADGISRSGQADRPYLQSRLQILLLSRKRKTVSRNGGQKRLDASRAGLELYIRQYIESQPVPVVSFAWQGGEPTLLGVDYFRKVVDLEKKYAGGKKIENGFQTNGILLDDAWCEFLAENQFLVGLSIDGPSEFHDHYRLYKGGGPTFADVMRGLELLKKHSVEFNTLTVVQRHNSQHPLEVYRFLRDVGSGFMQFIPIVERIAKEPTPGGLLLLPPASEDPAAVSDWSVEPLQYGKFLCAIFDEWVRRDVGRQYVQLFDVALESWFGMDSSLCVFRPTCGEAMVIEHNGDIYSCDHYVYPENRLGNITENPAAFPGRFGAAGQIRPGQAGHVAPVLQGMRRALCLQRRVPQTSICANSQRGGRAQLSLCRIQAFLQAHRSLHEVHGCRAPGGAGPCECDGMDP